MTLPPGQHAISGFPRFGTHFRDPPPVVPDAAALQVGDERLSLPLSDFPRREVTADFHCVAGWSATGLRWEGVPFAAVHERFAPPDATHARFTGLDGHWSVALLEDVLGDDVLLAEHLDGERLDGKHGAPLRLVSPGQYGFVNTKHLCRIEWLDSEPFNCHGSASPVSGAGLRLLGYMRFTRARVSEQERHRFLPAWLVRQVSKPLTRGIR